MKALQYKVRTLAPVVISTTSGEANLTGTLNYLAGSSILGVFASQYLSAGKGKATCSHVGLHQDERFYRWFLRGDLSFGNAYLAVQDEENTYLFYPTPLSLQQDKEEKTVYNLTAMAEKPDEETKALGGFSRLEIDRLIFEMPAKQLYFHHARKDRLKGRSEEGEIFHYEALNEEQLFVGRILGEEEDLKEFKTWFGCGFLAWVGRSKNAQYGQVEIELAEIEEIEENVTELINDDNTLVLTFLSPVILRNRYGFPEVSFRVLQEHLAKVLGTDGFTIEECYARAELVENFVSVWKLKRPAEKALAAGSTFKLTFNREPDSELQEKIKALCREGLGERRNEGFGRLTVNLATKERYSKDKLKPGELEKPEGSLPKEAKEIFKKIVHNNLETKMEKVAVDKSEEFFTGEKKLLPNSLLSRLELLLRESGNMDEFSRKIKNLRDTARDKLEGYRKKMTAYIMCC